MPDQSKIESIYVDIAIPCESVDYRPFPDGENNDLRYLSAFNTTITNQYDSYNMYVTPGGKLFSRPPMFATTAIGTGAGSIIGGKRIDRLWWYETMPDERGVVFLYFLASVYNPATLLWEMYYSKVGLPGWTIFTSMRDCNASVAPHIVTFDQGVAYIKGFPGGFSSEKLGTISFLGGGGPPAYKWWGVEAPATGVQMVGFVAKLMAAVDEDDTSWSVYSLVAPPATPFNAQIGYETITVTAVAGAGAYPRTDTYTVTRKVNETTAKAYGIHEPIVYRGAWAAPDHPVVVDYKWQYGVSYVTNSKQYSNLSPMRTNPDEMTSSTGPFNDLIPQMNLPSPADTANIPQLQVYRSPDGGGQFFGLELISNAGTGTQVYEDDSFKSGPGGTTENDPIPDAELDTTIVAPDLENSPPPTVNPPSVVGVTTPDPNTSKIARYARRHWYAIKEKLYYSAEEENSVGVLVECWPSGTFGNVINFTEAVVSLESVDTALYILTTRGPYILTGSSRDSFNVNFLGAELPMNTSMRMASCSFLNRAAFVTHDGRVCVITGRDVDIISESIGGVSQLASVQMCYLGDAAHQYLIICDCNAQGGVSPSKLYIYDWARSQRERRDFWFPPWVGSWTAMTTIKTTNHSNVVLAYYDYFNSAVVEPSWGTSTGTNSTRDDILASAAWATANFNYSARIGPIKNPAGNLVNTYMRPLLETALYEFKVDYVAGSAGVPGVGFSANSSAYTVAPTAVTAENPTRQNQSAGYTTKEYRPNLQVMMDYALVLSPGTFAQSSAGIQIQRIAAGTVPEAGING